MDYLLYYEVIAYVSFFLNVYFWTIFIILEEGGDDEFSEIYEVSEEKY
ncbi:hypothetical protein CAEBREN_05498 [Caenorhabditis brenneri]|uniref:Uncharacterized protein n=1 Tax=Caenorhabditis brenneri TaxID=135651 RepID=G0NSL9_CAEBE|nr:hypothetical protein CAEBREN_05498 [Caenorhabditis brenneri]